MLKLQKKLYSIAEKIKLVFTFCVAFAAPQIAEATPTEFICSYDEMYRGYSEVAHKLPKNVKVFNVKGHNLFSPIPDGFTDRTLKKNNSWTFYKKNNDGLHFSLGTYLNFHEGNKSFYASARLTENKERVASFDFECLPYADFKSLKVKFQSTLEREIAKAKLTKLSTRDDQVLGEIEGILECPSSKRFVTARFSPEEMFLYRPNSYSGARYSIRKIPNEHQSTFPADFFTGGLYLKHRMQGVFGVSKSGTMVDVKYGNGCNFRSWSSYLKSSKKSSSKSNVTRIKSEPKRAIGACARDNLRACSDLMLCNRGTFKIVNEPRKWANNSFGYEAKRRGLSCAVGSKAATILTEENIKPRSMPYTELCGVTVDEVKEAQKYLKDLDLYPYKIDGVAGKGTLAGIKKAKEMLGAEASEGECITSADIKAFDQLAAASRCSAEKLGQCSDAMVCDRATVLREGVRSWNFDEIAYVNRAKDLSLDCKITLDNTPFSQEEAVYYLSQLVDFVTENASDFDLKFASEYDKIRPITQGEWSAALSRDFELFRVYIAKFPSFQKHLEDLRLADDAANQKRIEQLRGALAQDMIILKEWAEANVLDAKAAEIASLDANFGNKSSQDVNALEQLVAETQRLLMATGIKDGPVQQVTQEVVDSLYDPSSVYLFVNTSGDAANVYKNLEGEFTFEQNSGTYCPTEKLGAFDYYLLRDRLFETFEGLSSVEQDCSQATDIFVVKGNELTTDRVFDVIPLSGLTQVSEFYKADRDKAYDQLTFLKETIQKDVLDGTRVGFGILKTDRTASKVCAIIAGDEYGHQDQLGQYTLLMNALNLQWDGFEKVTSSSEEAFKFLQRGQCDAIYAGSLNLGRLYLAGDIAGVSLEFLPIWISKASVEASQQAYDDSIAASAQAEQNLEDQAKLDEQAKQSAAELAAVRQRELREQNGLRFMVLKDELQEQVFAASEFGFNNPPEKASYIKRYLAQPFVDQTTRYSPFDGIIGDMQILAAERWEITEQRLDQIDYGEASFNGRSVDALQVELKIASKNRLVGKYSEYCRRIHAIKDEDFEMWRNISVTDCSNETATSRWKLENAFQSKWIVEPN